MSINSQTDQFIEILNSMDFNKITDHPNILIAAHFWDAERFCAAKICYKFMRAIDDLIDNHKANNKLIRSDEREDFIANVNSWLKLITVSEECKSEQTELLRTIDKFRIPLWPLEAFARSMIYDINNNGFPTLEAFLDYSQGASVAPASVFVHLSGLTRQDGEYREPAFDVKEAAMPCAIFSYLVHIIRDFQKDQLNNLNYFADDLLDLHGLSGQDLNDIANGSPASREFRNMVKVYYYLADEYRLKTFEVLKRIKPLIEPRYQLSLEVIFDLYQMIFERIDVENGSFTTTELNPTPEETKERVYKTIKQFQGS